MFTFRERAPSAMQPAVMAPLLGVVAGEFAQTIAQLWPAPHRPFMEAAADRRHVICLILDAFEVAGESAFPEAASLARTLEAEATRRLIKRFLPQASDGLPRALTRMGEIAWTGAQYRSLLRLLKDVESAKVLRHAERLEPSYVTTLELLPPPLRHGRVPFLTKEAPVAMLVGEAFEAVRRTHTLTEMEAVCARWRRAETLERLFEMAKEDLTPGRLPSPPFPEHPDMRHLESVSALEETGRRFRNCIATYAMRAASGDVVVYEWAGPPPAVLAISRDPVWGWRLEEARASHNESVPFEARAAILTAMTELGVTVGRGGYALSSVLDWAAREPLRAAAPWSEAEIFGY